MGFIENTDWCLIERMECLIIACLLEIQVCFNLVRFGKVMETIVSHVSQSCMPIQPVRYSFVTIFVFSNFSHNIVLRTYVHHHSNQNLQSHF